MIPPLLRAYRAPTAASNIFTALDGARLDFPLPSTLRLADFSDPRAWPDNPLAFRPEWNEGDVRALASLDDGVGAFPACPWLTDEIATERLGPCWGSLTPTCALVLFLDENTLVVAALPHDERDSALAGSAWWRALIPVIDAARAINPKRST